MQQDYNKCDKVMRIREKIKYFFVFGIALGIILSCDKGPPDGVPPEARKVGMFQGTHWVEYVNEKVVNNSLEIIYRYRIYNIYGI